MSVIRFNVEGIPVPQPRVRARVVCGHAGVYDPGNANDWKLRIADAAMKVRPERPITGPVALSAVFALPRPQSHFGKRGLRGSAPEAPIGCRTGDWDNLGKALCDALTDIGMWADDCIVTRAVIEKRYADPERPGAMIEITSGGTA